MVRAPSVHGECVEGKPDRGVNMLWIVPLLLVWCLRSLLSEMPPLSYGLGGDASSSWRVGFEPISMKILLLLYSHSRSFPIYNNHFSTPMHESVSKKRKH